MFLKKSEKKFWDIQLMTHIVPKACFEDPLGNVLRTSWGCPESAYEGRPLNVRLGRPLDVISGRQIGTSPRRQTRMSSRWSNRTSRGRPVDVGGGHPRDVLGTHICRLGINPKSDVYQRRSASMVNKVFTRNRIENECKWRSSPRTTQTSD